MARLVHPPALKASIVVTHKFRFMKVTANQVDTTTTQFLAILCVGQTAASVVRVSSAVRLRSIEVWGAVPTPPAIATSTLIWGGTAPIVSGFGTKATEISDTAMGTTAPPHFKATPPPGSWIDDYISDPDTKVLFTLVSDANTIIDMVVELVLSGNFNGYGAISVTTSVAGILYQAYLGTNDFKPIAFNTYTP